MLQYICAVHWRMAKSILGLYRDIILRNWSNFKPTLFASLEVVRALSIKSDESKGEEVFHTV